MYHIFKGTFLCTKEICVQINLPSKTYEDYYQSLSKHQRQNIRTAYNKLEKKGIKYHIEEYNASNSVSPTIAKKCQIMYEERCDRKNSYLNFRKLRTIWRRKSNFVNDLVLSASKRHMFILFFHKIPVAFTGGYDDDNSHVYYVPRLSTNEKYLEYSAGIILVNEIVKILINNKFSVLDLTRGTEPYKYAMGGEEHFAFNIKCKVNRLNKQ